MSKWFYLGIALLAGAAMAVQGTMNAALGKVVGLWESTLVVHVVGTLAVLAIIVGLGLGFDGLAQYGKAPWYVYLGGLLNVLIIYAVVRSIPRVGVGNATTAIVFAQLLTAVLIDHLGLFGVKKISFQYLDLLGVAMMAAAARILLNS
ncbi:MAG: DMT family transporter [Syntrophomonadaceae bacterium]|jgi:transporter family-2 protein|nr:DMT family transporter [Syntrophomonadaceae bacterium]